MKIIFSGGGTLGPVTPLLRIYEVYKNHRPDAQFVWVGTKNGPEREVVETYGLPFFMIGAGKWRRYWSWANIFDLLRIAVAFFQSIILLWGERPDAVISAGGFVSVPLHWAAALLGIPSWIHQQDVQVGLATKLMTPFAQTITTALEETVRQLPAKKTFWLGNPSRDLSCDLEDARKFFGFTEQEHIIFALGGGTGSSTVNQMILEALPSWPKSWHVIHLIGKDRPSELAERATKTFPNYHVYKFFTHEMAWAYALADVVVARAGFGTLTELAALAKPAIIVPMSETHQEQNAAVLAEAGAVVTLPENHGSGLKLAHEVRILIENPVVARRMGDSLHSLLKRAADEKIIGIVDRLAHQER